MTDAQTPEARILSAMADLGLTVHAEFIPWSKSRRAKEREPSLNWRVTLRLHGQDVLITEYSAGCGHCPSYRQGDHSVFHQERVRLECETGRVVRGEGAHYPTRTPINPKPADVMASLLLDASVLDFSCFEEWAQAFGYDEDSREAERIYRACLADALRLRAAVGDAGLQALQEATQGY